ncbi:MAG: PorT family protein [Bacteroidales bacterium]|nr:PorT family protein [Bacteroidales bacterium]
MKKTFLLLAVLLMIGSASFAQISNLALGENSDLAIGAKIGYQTSKLSYEKADIKSGLADHLAFGLFGRITSGRLYVQPELLYFKTSNAFDVTVTGTGEDNELEIPTGADAQLTLNSANLQVPIMVGVTVLDLDAVTVRAQVGPTANFVLKSMTLADYNFSLVEEDPVEEPTEPEVEVEDEAEGFDMKSIAWGVQAGIGIDVMKRVTLDVNYSFGLSKVFNALNSTSLGETFDFSNIDNSRRNMFMVSLGVKIF